MVRSIVSGRRRNIQNLLAYFGHHGARYLFPLVVTPFLAKMLGASQFAELVIWNSSVWSCSILIEFGFYMLAVTETAKANDDKELDKVLSTVVTAKILLTPIAISIYIISSHYLGLLAEHPVTVILGSAAVAAYGGSFAWYFQGRERGFTAVFAEASPQIFQCALVLVFVRGPHDWDKVVSFQVLAAVLPVAISFFIIRRERNISLSSLRLAVLAMIRSFPYFMERFCFTAYSAATPLMLAALSTHREAGYYGISDKVNAFLTGLSIPVTQLMLPIVARRVAQDGKTKLSFQIVFLLTGTTFIAATLLFFGIGPAIRWFFGSAYAPAVTPARWFCVAAVLMAYQNSLANFVIIPLGRARLMTFTSGGALVISFFAQIILVPRFGSEGSAIARTAAEASVALIFSFVTYPLLLRASGLRKWQRHIWLDGRPSSRKPNNFELEPTTSIEPDGMAEHFS